MVTKIFLSYSKHDGKIAGELKRFFEEFKNVECFVAHDDIIHGSEWEEEILKNLESANYFMPLQTIELTNSFWCQQEAGIAFARKIKIIPLIPDIEGNDPVGFYNRYQGFKIKINDLRGSVKLWLMKEGLTPNFNSEEIEKRKMIFAASGTWDEAADNTFQLLKLEDQFTNADILQILDIALGNGQINGSWSASAQLKRIFIKNTQIIPKDKLAKFLGYEDFEFTSKVVEG